MGLLVCPRRRLEKPDFAIKAPVEELSGCFRIQKFVYLSMNMNKSVIDRFFSLGSLNPRPIGRVYRAKLNKRYVGGDHVAIRVPTLSESLNGTFNSVIAMMSEGVKEVRK